MNNPIRCWILTSVLAFVPGAAWAASLAPSQAKPSQAKPSTAPDPAQERPTVPDPAQERPTAPQPEQEQPSAPSVKEASKETPARDAVDTYEQIRLLVDVLDFVQQNYVDEPDTLQLVYGAAEGMIAALDPFSQFLDPELHKDLKGETEGAYGGVGLRLAIQDRWLTVVTPMPGSPAYMFGILPNDRIVEIGGETTRDITMTAALKKLRGPPGTKVDILIMRRPSADPSPKDGAKDGGWTSHSFTLTRGTIRPRSVVRQMLEGDIGYIRITDFNARTPDDFGSAVKALKKDGMSSLILDLRNNPGGLLSAAIDVASFFMGENQLVVSTRGRKLDRPQEYRTGSEAAYSDIPLVILVNEGSASGSEIIAGAFQDHRRALVMGMRTYGKASVQSVIPLADGSGLRLTVARYYTPSGRMIHRDVKSKEGGIVPDIVVPISRETESRLYAQWDMIYAKDKKPKSAVRKEDRVADETLDRAVELLKARGALRALGAGDRG